MKVSLFDELRRVLNATDSALACAISHRQVRVDGYLVKATDDRRWTKAQLIGRFAEMPGRQARLFGGSRRALAGDRTQVVPRELDVAGVGHDGDI